jgi:hypothetical protein
MAISTSFKDIEKKFNPHVWRSIDEYEEYFLRRIQETQADRNYYTDRHGKEVQIGFIDHHPQLKEYEVWIEGYAATGERSGATLLGKAMARNFAQACDIVMCQQRLEWITKVNDPSYAEYNPPNRWSYDPHKLSDWGCDLFWSEELARKSFG